MIAHTRTSDGALQPLKAHCENVSRLCARAGEAAGLAQTAGQGSLWDDAIAEESKMPPH